MRARRSKHRPIAFAALVAMLLAVVGLALGDTAHAGDHANAAAPCSVQSGGGASDHDDRLSNDPAADPARLAQHCATPAWIALPLGQVWSFRSDQDPAPRMSLTQSAPPTAPVFFILRPPRHV